MLLALFCQLGTARASWMVPSPPNRAKDFCITKLDGWFHVFYILRNFSVPADSTERELGHAVSRDLYFWTQLPPVLQIRPSSWDNTKIWSPHIVEIDGVYYMFYTGVTVQPGSYAFYQQIGLATSTDLMTWNRLDDPILSCDRVRWAYCNPLSYSGGDFRDPFVMKDPAGTGWLMYYTARPVSDPNIFIAGAAVSSGDFTQWENREPLWSTAMSWSGSPVVESVHLFPHGPLYYLMFTGTGTQPLRILTGPDPMGAASTWTYRGTMGAMLGQDTNQWFASEYFADGTHDYFAFVNFDRVDVREIVWGAGWQFALAQPPQFHVQRMTWNLPEVGVGQPVRLRIEAVNTLGRGCRLEAVSLDDQDHETPVSLGTLGLPDSIPMPSTTVDYWWTAHAHPDPVEGGRVRLVVRLTDHTASTAPLTIVPNPWNPIGEPGPGDGVPKTPRAFEGFGARHTGPAFRPVHGSPLGETVLLVDLEAPAEARLEVFDLAGRRLRTLSDRELPAGATLVPWDGREENGAPARRGVYFVRLTTPTFQRTVRVLLTP